MLIDFIAFSIINHPFLGGNLCIFPSKNWTTAPLAAGAAEPPALAVPWAEWRAWPAGAAWASAGWPWAGHEKKLLQENGEK